VESKKFLKIDPAVRWRLKLIFECVDDLLVLVTYTKQALSFKCDQMFCGADTRHKPKGTEKKKRSCAVFPC